MGFTDRSVEKFLNSFKVKGLVEWRRQRCSHSGSSNPAASLSVPLGRVKQLQSFSSGDLRGKAELLASGAPNLDMTPLSPIFSRNP